MGVWLYRSDAQFYQTWERYSVHTTYAIITDVPVEVREVARHCGGADEQYYPGKWADISAIDSNGRFVLSTPDSRYHVFNCWLSFDNGQTAYYIGNSASTWWPETCIHGGGTDQVDYGRVEKKAIPSSTPQYEKYGSPSIITDISGTYPDDGIGTDGYYYVLKTE